MEKEEFIESIKLQKEDIKKIRQIKRIKKLKIQRKNFCPKKPLRIFDEILFSYEEFLHRLLKTKLNVFVHDKLNHINSTNEDTIEYPCVKCHKLHYISLQKLNREFNKKEHTFEYLLCNDCKKENIDKKTLLKCFIEINKLQTNEILNDVDRIRFKY